MPIPESKLSQWSHAPAATASVQAHESIRATLTSYKGLAKHTVFLQGSYRNNTNLRKDSDVDVVLQLDAGVRPKVAALSRSQLKSSDAHVIAYESWHGFRIEVLGALKAEYGKKPITSGRKSLKVVPGKIHAAADVVVTLRCGKGVALYLPHEGRWVVGYPQQHHERGQEKEKATGGRYKRTIRMFKAARNQLLANGAIDEKTVPSYFIECLLYNVPDHLFRESMQRTYCDVLDWLRGRELPGIKCQNGVQTVFGDQPEQWSMERERVFVAALSRMWDKWPTVA